MSKKKIIIISILFIILIIAILIIIGLKTINNEIEEVEIQKEINNSSEEIENNSKSENTENNLENESEEEELIPMTYEEYEIYEMETHLTLNRHLMATPTYKFKSDDFETIPKDSDWFTTVLTDLSGGPLIEDLYKNISNVEVYNLEETKTNFIIITMDNQTFIYQMYKDEDTEELTYKIFNTQDKTEAYIELISEKCTKIFSKQNPTSLDIGQW